jgi:hypothetical protein
MTVRVKGLLLLVRLLSACSPSSIGTNETRKCP